jgi:hypothetical protein
MTYTLVAASGVLSVLLDRASIDLLTVDEELVRFSPFELNLTSGMCLVCQYPDYPKTFATDATSAINAVVEK